MAPVFQCYGSHFQFTGALAPVFSYSLVHSYADSGTNYRHMAVFHISQCVVHYLLLCKYQYVVAEIS